MASVPPHVQDATFTAGDEASLEPGTTFDGCRFDGLELVEASVRGCEFLACTFEACDLTLLDLTDAALRDVRFVDCRLRAVELGAARDDALGIEAAFVRCDLDFLRVAGRDLRACAFEGGTAREAEFDACDLRQVRFDGVDLRATRFRGCDLREADLRRARGYAFDPTENRVRGLRVAVPDGLVFLRALGIELEG